MDNSSEKTKDNILISIMSDHILPNYLFAKEKIDCFDVFVFVTTKEMESRHVSDHFEHALGLEQGTVERIIVENDNYSSIKEVLSKCSFDSGDAYWVNLTGGTKAMSIAVHEFFSEYDSHFVYLPIGTNTFYDFDQKEKIDIEYRLSLDEYLKLYGLRAEYDNTLMFEASKAYGLFNTQKQRNFRLSEDIARSQQKPTREERTYYSGVWFEEYSYLRIKKELDLEDKYIGRGVKIYRDELPIVNGTNDNEIDVIFVKDNVLCIIECKVGIKGSSGPKKTLERYQYKLAAIAKDLGLIVKPYLFTLHRMSDPDSSEQCNKGVRL